MSSLRHQFQRHFLLMTLTVLALSWSVSAGAATVCVDNATNDGGDGVDKSTCEATCDGDGDCSLRDAVHAMQSGEADEIIFDPGLVGPITLTGSTLDIFYENPGQIAISIIGPGANKLTIQGDGSSRVITIPNAGNGGIIDTNDVTISGLTITGGKGGIDIGPAGGDSLTLIDSVVTGNDAGAEGGGGILIRSAPVTVSNSLISDNKANGGFGGGILVDAGGTPTLTVSNSTLDNNEADGGGGISYGANAGFMTILNSTISNNRAMTADGGGVWTKNATTITNSTISGNIANNDGGGLFVDNGLTEIVSSTFVNNKASATTGGGIFNGSTVELKNTIVANNTPGGDCATTNPLELISNGNNIDSDDSCGLDVAKNDQPMTTDPMLVALADNGGDTMTHAPMTGSPAIDAIAGNCEDDTMNAITKDQRSFTRPVDGDGDGDVDCDVGAHEVGTCGDGAVDDGEECDEGAGNSDDPGATCATDCSTVPADATGAGTVIGTGTGTGTGAGDQGNGGCSLIRHVRR